MSDNKELSLIGRSHTVFEIGFSRSTLYLRLGALIAAGRVFALNRLSPLKLFLICI
jgi:hypothetical protein